MNLKAIQATPDVVVLALALPLVGCVPFVMRGARSCMLKAEPASHLVGNLPHARNRISHLQSVASQTRAIVPLNNAISNELGIGIKTIDTHRLNVIHKLDLSTLAELVRYAVRHQIALA